MAALKLISHKLCPYVQRAVIALHEKGVPFERIDIDLANKPDWFLKISPLGKVPVLVVTGDDGKEVALFESNVICEYIEETQAGAKAASAGRAHARRASRLDGVRLGRSRRSLGARDRNGCRDP
ncbi:glutathione S-transferase [Bradyrhizobium sp. USDA 4461]